MSSSDSLAAEIYDACYITGEFKLRSGMTSNEYFDKYRFESNPHLLYSVGERMHHAAVRSMEKPDYFAGLEMGGIPLAVVLSWQSLVPTLFVRKVAKEYGTCQFVEGIDNVEGKNIVLVEDVITTGGQVVKSTNQLRELGANITTVIAAIDREQGGRENLEKAGLKLVSVFTASELKEAHELRRGRTDG